MDWHKERVNMVDVFFVFIYDDRKRKPVEIILRRGGRGMRENDGGGGCN
jgi:hypothetical protein